MGQVNFTFTSPLVEKMASLRQQIFDLERKRSVTEHILKFNKASIRALCKLENNKALELGLDKVNRSYFVKFKFIGISFSSTLF